MNKTRVVLINYANEPYKKTQHFNSKTGKYIAGFKEVIEYGPEDIDSDFYAQNEFILKQKRGNGEWLWKPYFILKTLEKLNEGEYVFYCDAGSFFCRSFHYIFDSMKEDNLWFSNIPLIEKEWTKPLVLETLDANIPEITETNQIQGGFICVRKCEKSVDFIKKWLEYCCRQDLLLPLGENEKKGFCISHREDQSIVSVMCKKAGIIPHKDPTQFGRVPEKYFVKDRAFKIPDTADTYPVSIILHRTPDVNIKISLKQLLCAWLPLKTVYRLTNLKRIQ